ncbi:hypothetical protein DFH07DRAFT_952643 [Mycena maculata]|uniref:Fungal N-terminal domain-containing protein n=1 Tax=Mycena maculata TaxID=230809 RepID=A0AAD7JZA0_9AGAR|nr:hypothetical protein DFH07DRAFT_952643 [Mycena maculata]
MAATLGTITSILQLVDTAQTARELIQDFRHAPEEQRRLLSEMDDLRLLIEELQLRPVEAFHSMMEHFTEKLKEGKGPLAKFRNRLSWTMWSKKETTEYLDKFEQFKSLANSWLSLDIRDMSQCNHKAVLQSQEHNHNTVLQSVDDVANAQQHNHHWE